MHAHLRSLAIQLMYVQYRMTKTANLFKSVALETEKLAMWWVAYPQNFYHQNYLF